MFLNSNCPRCWESEENCRCFRLENTASIYSDREVEELREEVKKLKEEIRQLKKKKT